MMPFEKLIFHRFEERKPFSCILNGKFDRKKTTTNEKSPIRISHFTGYIDMLNKLKELMEIFMNIKNEQQLLIKKKHRHERLSFAYEFSSPFLGEIMWYCMR